MKFQLLNRKVHYWLSLAIALPAMVIFVTGVLLQLKKYVHWIQPAEQRGVGGPPRIGFDEMLERIRSVPELDVEGWEDVDRIDFRPRHGMAKVRGRNHWELQLDTSTGEVLQVAYRRSDIIESIHDGGWFSEWIKMVVFTPTAVVLIIMWATGVYLFILPLSRKWGRARH